jgi:hypothetical protein
MLYRLSMLFPTPMRATYSLERRGAMVRQRSTWWQWRGRVWSHHIHPA